MCVLQTVKWNYFFQLALTNSLHQPFPKPQLLPVGDCCCMPVRLSVLTHMQFTIARQQQQNWQNLYANAILTLAQLQQPEAYIELVSKTAYNCYLLIDSTLLEAAVIGILWTKTNWDNSKLSWTYNREIPFEFTSISILNFQPMV